MGPVSLPIINWTLLGISVENRASEHIHSKKKVQYIHPPQPYSSLHLHRHKLQRSISLIQHEAAMGMCWGSLLMAEAYPLTFCLPLPLAVSLFLLPVSSTVTLLLKAVCRKKRRCDSWNLEIGAMLMLLVSASVCFHPQWVIDWFS